MVRFRGFSKSTKKPELKPDPWWTYGQILDGAERIPQKAEEVDTAWRQYGVQIAKKAAHSALLDSEIQASDITHLVAVTATNSGSPGYDQIVARELGIPATAERLLISGVGCAGGLAALRMASNLARAATSQGRPARILVLACEICSIFISSELHAASTSQDMGIGVTLFGDGAAALVVCNSHGMTRENKEKNLPRRFSIVDSRSAITPGTHDEMEDKVTSTGFRLVLSKNVPKLTSASLARPFQSLIMENGMSGASATDFDWAVHPGGLSIIKGAQAAMGLPDELVVASNEIYRTRGNTSSVAVLAVLERLRTMEMRKQDVIASSFGPGLTTEMMLLKRWQ
ncbi:chalcone synthase B [Penicillium pulvis]|uniref:chalcone synthase B n=1 Tax=Penicillium pulvis TaxID=1562058 RepID=UPI002548C83A|nr:chalcone synthase B [Penicillium pulvis]KAJ5813400.1 chalcone synthase B [Penicillium pulvis]